MLTEEEITSIAEECVFQIHGRTGGYDESVEAIESSIRRALIIQGERMKLLIDSLYSPVK